MQYQASSRRALRPVRSILYVALASCLAIYVSGVKAARAQTPAEALTNLASQIVGRPQVFTQGPVPDDLQAHRAGLGMAGPSATFVVDAASGLLLYYDADDATTLPSVDSFTRDQAVSVAEAFLQRAEVPMDPWTLEKIELFDHGTPGRAYMIHWVKLWNGIHLPAFIDIEVSERKGVVDSYALLDDPVQIAVPAVLVTGDQALQIMVQHMEIQQPVVNSVYLRIQGFSSYPGTQRLVWQVVIRDLQPLLGHTDFVDGDVDANTGQILNVAVPGAVGMGGRSHPRKPVQHPEVRFAKGVRIPPVHPAELKHSKLPPSIFRLAEQDGRRADLIAKLRTAVSPSP